MGDFTINKMLLMVSSTRKEQAQKGMVLSQDEWSRESKYQLMQGYLGLQKQANRKLSTEDEQNLELLIYKLRDRQKQELNKGALKVAHDIQKTIDTAQSYLFGENFSEQKSMSYVSDILYNKARSWEDKLKKLQTSFMKNEANIDSVELRREHASRMLVSLEDMVEDPRERHDIGFARWTLENNTPYFKSKLNQNQGIATNEIKTEEDYNTAIANLMVTYSGYKYASDAEARIRKLQGERNYLILNRLDNYIYRERTDQDRETINKVINAVKAYGILTQEKNRKKEMFKMLNNATKLSYARLTLDELDYMRAAKSIIEKYNGEYEMQRQEIQKVINVNRQIVDSYSRQDAA